MKVYIGPYTGYFGPYDLAELLKYVGVGEDRRYEIGEWLDSTWFGKLIRRCNDAFKRDIKVRIDPYDTWSMDHTLALIVLPMLKQLRVSTHCSGRVEDKDVPKHLRSTNAPPKENEWDIDDNYHARWEWALDEMIWTFEQLAGDDTVGIFIDEEGKLDYKNMDAFNKRLDNGLRLFGKYYRSLWD